MKKEDISALIVYMFIIAIAIVFSFTVLRTHFEHSGYTSGLQYAGVIILALIVGVVSSAILSELGHILGAKAGKYEITSVCILFFTFYKEEKKWKFKFGNFDGLTGETKIYPKDKASNPRAYLLLGTLFLALWAIGCFVIFSLFNGKGVKEGDLAYFFLTIMVVVLICLIYNILPLKLDTRTDGCSLRMMSNPRNKYAFNEMLRIEKEVKEGNNNVEIETFTDLTNYTVELNLNKVYVLLDQKKYDEADEILEIILNNKNKISSRLYLRTLAMKIYNKVITSTPEEATKYLNETVDMGLRHELSDDNSFMAIRAYILLEGLTDMSKSECLLAIGKVNSAYKRINKNRRASEARMYNDAIDYICIVHPKWEFEQYKIDLKNI